MNDEEGEELWRSVLEAHVPVEMAQVEPIFAPFKLNRQHGQLSPWSLCNSTATKVYLTSLSLSPLTNNLIPHTQVARGSFITSCTLGKYRECLFGMLSDPGQNRHHLKVQGWLRNKC